MTVAVLVSRPGNMPGYNTAVELDEVQSLSSNYSYPQPSMVPNAPSMFSFSHTESSDLLHGSSWSAQSEESQTFQEFVDSASSHSGDAEEYLFTSGQTTPRGSRTDRSQASDAVWSARIAASAPRMTPAMSRVQSSGSTASRMSQVSHMSRMDNAGNATTMRNGPQPTAPIAALDSCLLLDPSSAVVQQHMYWPNYPLDMSLCTENSGVFALSEPGPLHVVPAHINMGAESRLPDHSSPNSWDCFSSPISRTSSPATNDDAWLSAPLSPHSSPDISGPSPRPEHKVPVMPVSGNEAAPGQLHESDISQTLASRRQISDGESARDHELYKNATPREDGLFHCPWEGQQSCNHKPEKLKCNYDKFVDSHLKPYKCKSEGCETTRFSSTACLLRHEREAHGLHGHGDKPYLCVYDGCDRALPGNGFPRQWNLRDHMKRVHNDHRTAAGSPPAGAGAQAAKCRKRKTDVPEPKTSASRKASVKSMPVAEPAPSARPLLDQWMDHRRTVEDIVRGLSKPDDSRNLQQITEVQKRLSAMAKMTTELTDMPKPLKQENFSAPTRKNYGTG